MTAGFVRRTSTGIDAIAVIVPVHDEDELLAACLTSISLAAAAVRGVQVAVVVVLDACTDGSAAIAAEFDVETVVIDAQSVGVARAAGVAAARRRFTEVAPARLWTAHTDADSGVPRHWLSTQLSLARNGADIIVGTVRPDFSDLTEGQRAAWQATHRPGVANGHVHGANLGVRASTLIDAGGFEPIAEHEDVRIVERARHRGARIVATDDAWVRTSGRQRGRTPGGYARYLREDLVPLAAAEHASSAENG